MAVPRKQKHYSITIINNNLHKKHKSLSPGPSSPILFLKLITCVCATRLSGHTQQTHIFVKKLYQGSPGFSRNLAAARQT